jgi:HTH-type transcriptional regulator, sugar sensing transcriptional regulator
MDELIKEMQKIGFTIYEAKIYIALLKQNPSTGYELSKISGVPQAKVYENISRLINSGAVLTVGSEPTKYVPLPPEELLKSVHTNFEKSINTIQDTLSKLNTTQNAEYVWNIKGYNQTMEKAKEIISNSKDSLMLSLWEDEILHLYEELIQAINRGVIVDVLIYGSNKLEGIDNVYYHGSDENLKELAGGRWLTLISDKKEVITGQAILENDGISIWTSNPSIVFISSRYIEHEIYISKKLNGGN